jgi:hypothetical protein
VAIGRASAAFGAREVRRFALVAVAAWLADIAAMIPAWLVLVSAISSPLGRLPNDLGSLPPGELAVIVRAALAGMAKPLQVALAAGVVLLWSWRVLWRAGMAWWRVWAGERNVRIGELLGLGLTRWWPVARVHLVGLAVAGTAAVTIATGALMGVFQAWASMAERRLVAVVIVGVTAVVLVLAVGRAATLAGVWRLTRPDRRSVLPPLDSPRPHCSPHRQCARRRGAWWWWRRARCSRPCRRLR